MNIIDSDDYKASGIDAFFFPGGEPHAKVLKTSELMEQTVLYLKLRTWNDVGLAIAVKNALDISGTVYDQFIPYFPGARQDRIIAQSPYTPFTLVLMDKLLLGDIPQSSASTLFTFDIHSSRAQLHTMAENFMPDDLVNSVFMVDGVIAPDAGALSRAERFADKLCVVSDPTDYDRRVPVIECTKQRDPNTGQLSHYTMMPLAKAGRYIIVDDICDGGGTFNLLAEAFNNDPFGKQSTLEMWVSHGIFSHGLDAISPTIKHIYTTDSFCTMISSSRLTVCELYPLLSKIRDLK